MLFHILVSSVEIVINMSILNTLQRAPSGADGVTTDLRNLLKRNEKQSLMLYIVKISMLVSLI